jgi:hypothetical protein
MADIVERLHGQLSGDHKRGCQGRCYSCECGYDTSTESLMAEAADEIEQLRKALDSILSECDEAPTDNNAWVVAIQKIARASALTPANRP